MGPLQQGSRATCKHRQRYSVPRRSPYTSSIHGGGAFQYTPTEGHKFDLGGADVVITHSPPRGILDRTDDKILAGCPNLFDAVARARPRLHCFGHIHEGWGAKLVTWRGPTTGDEPLSHLTAISGENTAMIESRRTLYPAKFDTEESQAEKADKLATYMSKGFCETAPHLKERQQTLFVNAAIQDSGEGKFQLPWVVDIQLPASTSAITVDAPPVPTSQPKDSEVPQSISTATPSRTVSRKRPLSDAEDIDTFPKRPRTRLLQRCGPKLAPLLSLEPACI
ncbi:hypothetical protein DL546_006264 [Coniochaeta pulveracea]|uniref:Calcineurin-like phosphoesterase domain-containing protein n=1 Tax=Coniochaeta pulveracea TaxID=177199 RepID=A0A420YI72_9PEZI|nr:hypothetical protein DL546_006264 [Coniochaeta pulveracea]